MVKLTEALVLARSRASDLDNVRKLNCWGSELTDVSILRRVPRAQVVSLSVNQISTLADFAHCPDLEELYIRKNDIQSLSELRHLKKLPKLTKLWLADNPCADCDKYRLTVLKALPNIQKLDNATVTQDEVNQALDEGLDLDELLGGSVDKAETVVEAAAAAAVTSPAAAESKENESETNNGADKSETKDISSQGEGSEEQGACGDSNFKPTRSGSDPTETSSANPIQNPVMISWDETNKIRQQLGLKLLPVEKVTKLKPRTSHSAKDRNSNLLQAVLHLIKELDAENLEIVSDAIRSRLDVL